MGNAKTKAKKAAKKAAKKVTAPAKKTAAKKVKAAPKPKIERVVQNDMVRPAKDTITGRVWDIADKLTKPGAPAMRKDVIEKALAEKINPATIATQYGKWRVFNGLVGKKAPRAAAKPAKAAKKAAAKPAAKKVKAKAKPAAKKAKAKKAAKVAAAPAPAPETAAPGDAQSVIPS